MTQPILSISGLRGIVGDGLDPAYIVKFAQALGTLAQRKTVVVGRDGRATGVMLKRAVLSGLESAGCRVIDIGIAATPTCGFLVRQFNAGAGIEITASHNPIAWNGLKPFSADGSVFNETAGRMLLNLLETNTAELALWDSVGTTVERPETGEAHIQTILELVDVVAIRECGLKVVLDCSHGAGAILGPRMLEILGCEVFLLGAAPDGLFEHPPEPLKQNLTGLCETVRRKGADVGFAQDPDADRLAIVDGEGHYIGEELTLALCADHVLSQRTGPVVVNGSTSRVTADVAARHRSPFHRSYVGEAHVVAKMRELSAVFGGEGNGGVIEPKVGFVRDSFVGMAYVLAGLAAGRRSLAEWANSLPAYSIVKDKLECPRERSEAACQALSRKYSDATATTGDGLRLDWPDRWVQVRASNTEPILRVIAEAPDQATAAALCAEAIAAVREAVSQPMTHPHRVKKMQARRHEGTRRHSADASHRPPKSAKQAKPIKKKKTQPRRKRQGTR